jgi:alkylation response protein AidB-like acyl-CoA dehydrogenase
MSDAVDLALGKEGSAGKRAALELAEEAREDLHAHTTFAGSLFLGRTPWDLIHPFPAPAPAEAAAADAFLARLGEVLRREIDPERVDLDEEIPDAAVAALKDIGAFGIKIPREYGGLGLGQVAYTRAALLAGSHCASTTAFLSAHQSIGLPQPLKLFGTPEQKKRYLPRLAAGALSAFALTEEGAGSDPARMETTAVPTADGRGWILNGTKLWCTNGTRAELLVVVAKTPAVEEGGRRRDRFTAFIVDGRAPGLRVEHRCRFMGMRGLYNAALSFKDLAVPAEDRLGPEGRGMKLALTTLNTGRLTLPAAATGVAKRCLGIARTWGAERVQWGAPVGSHAAVADKIGRMAATVLAMEAMTLLTSGLVDAERGDIRIEAGMCKMWATEALWDVVNDCLQVRGGRGYETGASLRARGEKDHPVERMLRDARINTVFEGSSEILRLFLAREALDPHLGVAGDVLNARLPAGRRARGALRAGLHYAAWYPSTFWPFGGSPAGMAPPLARHAAGVGRGSRRLARRLFHAMAARGPALEREQVLLGRFVDAGTELFARAATLSYADHLLRGGAPAADLLPLVDLFCEGSVLREERALRGVRRNADAAALREAARVLAGRHRWLEAGAAEVLP